MSQAFAKNEAFVVSLTCTFCTLSVISKAVRLRNLTLIKTDFSLRL